MQDKNTHEGIDKYIKLQSIVAHSPDPLKIIISTGTKTLQDQLYKRDLPLIAKVLGSS